MKICKYCGRKGYHGNTWWVLENGKRIDFCSSECLEKYNKQKDEDHIFDVVKEYGKNDMETMVV